MYQPCNFVSIFHNGLRDCNQSFNESLRMGEWMSTLWLNLKTHKMSSRKVRTNLINLRKLIRTRFNLIQFKCGQQTFKRHTKILKRFSKVIRVRFLQITFYFAGDFYADFFCNKSLSVRVTLVVLTSCFLLCTTR